MGDVTAMGAELKEGDLTIIRLLRRRLVDPSGTTPPPPPGGEVEVVGSGYAMIGVEQYGHAT